MIWPQPISLCTSTIESAVYENRTYSAVRGRRLVTASYSIVNGQGYLLVKKREEQDSIFPFSLLEKQPIRLLVPQASKDFLS